MFYYPMQHRIVLAFRSLNVKLWDAVTNLPFRSHAQKKKIYRRKNRCAKLWFANVERTNCLSFPALSCCQIHSSRPCGKVSKSSAKGKQGLLGRDTQSSCTLSSISSLMHPIVFFCMSRELQRLVGRVSH